MQALSRCIRHAHSHVRLALYAPTQDEAMGRSEGSRGLDQPQGSLSHLLTFHLSVGLRRRTAVDSEAVSLQRRDESGTVEPQSACPEVLRYVEGLGDWGGCV
jgi:hypothetical protein